MIIRKSGTDYSRMAIPFFWALMTNKTTGCYQQIFQFIADNFTQFKPKYSMSDHEMAIRNGLKLAFPEIETKTCYFHYTQNVMKNAQNHKLIDQTMTKNEYPEIYIVIHRLMALALLPSSFIENTFKEIKKICEEDFGHFCDSYLNYYEKQWLKNEGAEQISVYHQIKNRSDNYMEAYHRQINALVTKCPDHNLFLGVIKTVALDARADFWAVRSGTYESREKTKETIDRNFHIESLWSAIDENLNDPEIIESKNLLKFIDTLPQIVALKKQEHENMKKMIDNVMTKEGNLLKNEKIMYLGITEIDNEESIIEKLIKIRRHCFQYQHDLQFILVNLLNYETS